MPLLAAMPMGALLLDQDQSVRSINQIFLDWLGYRDEEVLGRHFADFLLPSQATSLADWLDGSRGDRFELDLCFVPAQGGSRPAKVAFSRLPDPSRQDSALLAVLLEYPGETLAQGQEARADEAMRLARVSDWELDVESGRLLASRNWLDIWDLSPESVITLDLLLTRIHPLDRQTLLGVLERARNLGQPFHIRFRILRANGELRWLESTGRPDSEGPLPAARLRGAVLDISDRQRAEQALKRYADIVSASPDRIAFVDRGCRVQAANAAFFQAAGRASQEVINRPWIEIHGASPLTTLLYRHLGRCLDREQTVVEDIHETSAEGRERHAEVRLFPNRDEHGRVTGIVIYIRDVTSVRDAERRLLQSAAVYSATSEGVMITDPSGVIVGVNAAFKQITGYTEAEVLGQKPNLLNSQWHSRSFFVGMWRRLRRQGSWQGEVWNRRKDGEIHRQRLTIRRVLDPRGKVVNYVGVFAERDASSASPQRTEHLIHYDALTKLPNRLLFESRLEHAIELGRRKESPLALFILDLDHFANINASLGHQIGDDLLRAVALRLRETIRPADTLARLRADQFALLFEETAQVEEVIEIARRLQDTVRRPIWVRNHQLHVNISLGITLANGLDDDRNSLIANAESALREVKRQGRNGYRISTTEPNDAFREHRRLLERLRAGLKRREFHLLYRPTMDMANNVCDGVAASIHWEAADLGMVPPERFLPLANESGLILEIGNWALETACQQLAAWMRAGLSINSLAIAIHEAQITRGELIRTLTQLLGAYPLVASRLELEVSECLLVKHREQVAELFQGLNQLGFAITLVDVGIGWTAPAVLQRLPIRALKIHSSFIEALPEAHHELAVAEAVIAMSQSLGLEIRADGVRTEEQKYQLLNIGCLKAQGDLFGSAMTPSGLESWMNPKPRTTPRPPLRS